MIHFETFVNIEAGKRNYIAISEECNGRVWVNSLICGWTDTPEIANYEDALAVDCLGVGESHRLTDSNAVVVRIA